MWVDGCVVVYIRAYVCACVRACVCVHACVHVYSVRHLCPIAARLIIIDVG